MGGEVTRVPFVWSMSRHRTLQRCPRAYWYDYYGSRGGWRSKAAAEARELYLLKGLKSVPQWVGIEVHEVAERVVGLAREGRSFDLADTLADVRRRALRTMNDAKAGMYRLNPKRYHGFLDVEYGTETPERWAAAIEDLVEQVEAALTHPIMLRIFDVPARVVEVEQLERVPVAGVPTWVSLDVLVEDGRGGYVVVDWKTGRHVNELSVSRQVALYAAYVQRRYDVPASGVRGLIAYTRTKQFREVSCSPADLAEVRELVQQSAAEMRAHGTDPDSDEAPIEAFDLLPEGSETCATCRYRRICGRE